MRVVHVALEAPAEVVTDRLRARAGDQEWGLVRVAGCVGALRDARFATHLDASSARPRELAEQIAALVGVAAPPVRV